MSEPVQNNPYQQAPAEELTLGEALRAMAERTAFRTEDESRAVLAAIDKQIGNDKDGEESESEPVDQPEETDEEFNARHEREREARRAKAAQADTPDATPAPAVKTTPAARSTAKPR